MKRFFSKLKTVFMILLIVPMMFVFSSCGKDNDSTGSGGGSSGGIEQPEGGSGNGGNSSGGGSGSGGDAPVVPEVNVDKFTVAVNYNLPAFYEGLLESKNESVAVENGYTLPNFSGTEYYDYFDGWFLTSDDSEIVESKINAEKDETVSIYAKWKESEMNQTFATAGLQFEFAKDDGQRDYAVPVSYSGTSSIVVIPQVVMKDGVTACYVDTIGENAFKNNQTVKEVRTKMLDFSVKNSAFEGSTLETVDFSKMIDIGTNAFKNSNVKNVVFSNKLNSISNYMFAGCVNLESVDFSAVTNPSLTTIKQFSFYGCEKLEDVELSSAMTSIETSAFENCVSLSSFEFVEESGIVSLGGKSFAGCLGIGNLVIPARIVSYGTGDVFAGAGVKNITLSNLWYSSSNGNTATFTRYYGDLSATLESVTLTGSSITKIYRNYFKNYSNLKTFVMTDSVTLVEVDAFYGCGELDDITFSAALKSDDLNLSAFLDTKWYKEVEVTNYTIVNDTLIYVLKEYIPQDGIFEIPDGVRYLRSGLFDGTKFISTVKIPASVEYIHKKAFAKSNIENIEVHQDNQNYKVEGQILFELDEVQNKVALLAYFGNDGGVFAVPTDVEMVYDYAFSMKNAPEYVFVSGENVEVQFDGYASAKYVFANNKITSNANPNLVIIYNYLSKSAGGYTVENNQPVFVNYNNLPEYSLVIVTEEDGAEGVYYYLVTANAGGVLVQELDGFCPYIGN